MQRRVWTFFRIAVACLVAVCCALPGSREREIRPGEETGSRDSRRAVVRIQTDMVDQAAPDFLLPDLDGNALRLSDFRGQIVLVSFWGTWCPPCRGQIPHFMALSETYGDQGFMIIGIAVDRNGAADVRRFLKAIPVNYLILTATDEVQDAFGGIPRVPTTFLIDGSGRIRKQYVGYQDREVFETGVQELLAAK